MNTQELTFELTRVKQLLQQLETRVSLVETLEPGKIHTDHPHIVRVQGVCGGRPIIEGTRISVKVLVDWAKQGLTVDDLLVEYPFLTAIQVEDALAYYEDHPEEIEAEFQEEQRYIEVVAPRLQKIMAEKRGKYE